MEVEMKPVDLEAKVRYLQKIAENQQNSKTFPWGLVFISFVIGVGLTYTIVYYRNLNKKKKEY